MQLPEGYTQQEWNDLTDAEREGILGELSDDEKALLEEVAGKGEEPGKPGEDGDKKAVEGAKAADAGGTEGDAKLSPEVQALIEENRRLQELLKTAITKEEKEPEKKEDEPKPYDFDGAEERYMDAVTEGDRELAKEIRREIRSEEAKLLRQQTNETVTASDEAKAEAEAVGKVVVSAYEKFPFLDIGAAEAVRNIKAINMVRNLAGTYMGEGLSRADAIAKAVEDVGPLFAPERNPDTEDKKPNAAKPDIKTLGNIPQAKEENTNKDPYAALDELEGEDYEAALEKLNPAQREAYLKRI